jgi:phytoene/squalene synthetase
MDLYLENALQCSKETTHKYSTSFSLGVRLLDKSIRDAIYAIYAYVRFADEIVDTFYGHNQKELLQQFREQTDKAIEEGLSTNPIIHSFQWVVNTYSIEHHLIDAFLTSMAMDLSKTDYSATEYKKYIYGSAEVVGLMCLQVFCYKSSAQYNQLIEPARKLGEAFQKVNFLRDIEADYDYRGRTYFPDVDFKTFTKQQKESIENEIQNDFDEALKGIVCLPLNSRFGVYLAYAYYRMLLKKIMKASAHTILKQRIRVSNTLKIWILIKLFFRFYLRQGNLRLKNSEPYESCIKTENQSAYA